MERSHPLATAVESTTLVTVAYDAPTQSLWLEFHSRAVYCYFEVPPAVYHGLMTAPSKGAYFNRNIRGRFLFHKESHQR
jgi:lysyl-tRNA synthetase class 2